MAEGCQWGWRGDGREVAGRLQGLRTRARRVSSLVWGLGSAVCTEEGKSTSAMRMPSASSILPWEMSSTPCSTKEVTKPLAKKGLPPERVVMAEESACSTCPVTPSWCRMSSSMSVRAWTRAVCSLVLHAVAASGHVRFAASCYMRLQPLQHRGCGLRHTGAAVSASWGRVWARQLGERLEVLDVGLDFAEGGVGLRHGPSRQHEHARLHAAPHLQGTRRSPMHGVAASGTRGRSTRHRPALPPPRGCGPTSAGPRPVVAGIMSPR